jgi:hypothetical protein
MTYFEQPVEYQVDSQVDHVNRQIGRQVWDQGRRRFEY